MAGFAFDEDVAVVGVHGFADEKEFEADFFPVGAADIKGVEDFFEGAFIQPRAVVADGEADVFPGGEEAGFFSGGNFFQRNKNFAGAFGEAVPALEAEFDEGGLDLRGVGGHGGALRIQAGVELDFGGEDGAENGQGVLDDAGKADGFEVGGRALGEFAEFDDEVAGAMGGFKNMGERFARGMFFREVEGDDFGGAKDGGDEVVEFVRGAGGELVERGEFQVVKLLELGGVEFFFSGRHGVFRLILREF